MKTVLNPVIALLFLIITAVPAHADGTHPKGIKLDGTLGSAGKLELPGPDYDIKAEHGQQAGANLFHSFQQFNIHSDESATFTGPNSVQNIISRVTGGSASWIDGRLGSTMPGADLFMLNPAGLMFGPNASLDLSGSFHASTADYLRFGENDRFYSTPHANDVLSVAAPSAFGFLDSDISPITYEGRGEITEHEWENNPTGLHVSEGKTISLIGGNIEMTKGTHYKTYETDEDGNLVYEQATDEWGDPAYETETGADGELIYALDENGNLIPVYVTDEDGNPIPVLETERPGDVVAPGGRIDIAGVASPGEVTPAEADLNVTSAEMGNVTLSDRIILSADGDGGGSIFIRGGKLVAQDSSVQAETLGDRDGGRVDIQADELSFTSGAKISCDTEGTGRGADIEIGASDSVSFSGENSDGNVSVIRVTTDYEKNGAGDAGRLEIEAGNISFADGAWINSDTEGKGKGGEVILSASDSVSFAGEDSGGDGSGIQVTTDYKEDGAGDAGHLEIRAGNISFADGTWINSATYGKGKGGEVSLSASDSVSFAGEDSAGYGSKIQMTTRYKEDGAGDAGRLEIEARNISFADGAWINSTTYGKGKGGEVSLSASDSVSFAGENSNGVGSMIQMATIYGEDGAGDAGHLEIEARNISFADGAWINSATYGKGKGGEVSLSASDSVSFAGERSNGVGSKIQMTTLYEEDGAGDAGRLEIEAGNISFADGAYVNSTTYGRGKGGEVILSASNSVSFAGEDSNGYGMIQMITDYKEDGAGDAGRLEIRAGNISFADGAGINSATRGKGKGGEIILSASDSVSFAGENSGGDASMIVVATVYEEDGAGDAGHLEIESGNISFSDGARINSATHGKGKGGEIILSASDSVSFAGEASDGEASKIFVATGYKEEGAGDAGRLEIESGNISFSDGAYVDSGTYGRGDGGTVRLQAAETVTLSGADSEGEVSRIYAGSESTAENAGTGGRISVSAETISLSRGGTISTSGEGGGKAGDIELSANRILMDTGASVSSGSAFVNARTLSDMSERDRRILISGDVVEVSDTGDGRSVSYVFTDDTARLTPAYAVANLSELETLTDRHAVSDGDIAEVADAGDGKPARYAYASKYESEEWTRFDPDNIAVTFDDMREIDKINDVQIFYEDELRAPGTVIRVSDAGDGKPATFVYAVIELPPGYGWWVKPVRLSRFDVPDTDSLSEFSAQFSVRNGDVANVADAGDGNPSEFVFHDGEWIRFNNIHTVADMSEAYDLILVLPGSVADVEDAGDGNPATFVYSGRDWITLRDVHNVADMAARDALPAREGDVAEVADSGAGKPEHFLYSGENWVGFAGGDAGSIDISADTLRMTGGSSITSASSGHGHASDIILETGRLEADSDSTISSENKSGRFGGDAGRIVIAGEVRVEKNDAGEIVSAEPVRPANAVRLRGGSMITTDGTSSGGGEISIQTKDSLHLSDSEITTSVSRGEGGGGDIRIGNTGAGSQFVILNHSRIRANADGGDGGAIFIVTDNFLTSSDSVTEARSDRGNDGTIKIEAPDIDVAGDLTVPGGDSIDASRWLPKACSERDAEDYSEFFVMGKDATPDPPNDVQASPPRHLEVGSEK